MSRRFVVVGLASPRSGWFREVARWSSAGTLAAELELCLHQQEAVVRLTGGRPTSALLVDGTHPGADRDLFALARRAGAAVLVVDDGPRPWAELGADAVLSSRFDLAQLVEALDHHATAVDAVDAHPPDDGDAGPDEGVGTLVAVTGAAGSGTSTTARALAQGLAGERTAGSVVLADLALHADQALSHDVGDVLPGVQELVEACRTTAPTATEVHQLTWEAPHLGYRLLLGLRRHRDWTALRERSVATAVAALRRAFDAVVVDVDPDVEGEQETGSLDVADRNLLARTALRRADLVLVTARPDVRGLHRLALHVHDLIGLGVAAERILPVLVGAPRRPAARARLTAAVAQVLPADGDGRPAPPLQLGRHHDVERAVRDGRPLPRPLARACAAAATTSLVRLPPAGPAVAPEPVAVTPGSLGLTRPGAGHDDRARPA